ncbi:NUDIX hydrolase [Palleronia abyssalis]|uniref:8-oxo-dGTP diphosphatase n=1 Tax=Palleronia abyssalis TaxID=1501240 RepID=A0A2R8BRF7_9RHOB|nr:NUDIX hydrolase [Palleronia abyssalis]SPJ22676.1 8-oxo-dGTP diphosphatase [Palleronia abyssalis]
MPNDTTPDRPIPATIAIVIRSGQVLLVRRANPPDAGRWGFPGGKIDRGETLEQAALRELGEETGVSAKAIRAFTALDVFDRDDAGQLRRHFVLIAVLCQWMSGDAVAADDALEVRWVDVDGIAGADLALSVDVAAVAAQAASLAQEAQS